MDIVRCMDMFLITKILDLAYVRITCVVYRKISQTLSYLGVYVFTVFTIKRPKGASEDNDKYTLTIT